MKRFLIAFGVYIGVLPVYGANSSDALENFKKIKGELASLTELCGYKDQNAFRALQIAHDVTPFVLEMINESKACDARLRENIKASTDSLKSEFSSDQAKLDAIREWYVGYNDGIDAMSKRPMSAVPIASSLSGLSDSLVRKLEF